MTEPKYAELENSLAECADTSPLYVRFMAVRLLLEIGSGRRLTELESKRIYGKLKARPNIMDALKPSGVVD